MNHHGTSTYIRIYYRPNSIYPAPWWSWCVTACRLSTVSGCASSPHWQSRGLWGPCAGTRAPCAAGAAPHRLCRCGLPPRCPRGLGQGSNAAAAHVAKVADCSLSGQTVDSCGAEIVGRFNFSELPYKLPHKQKHTNLRSYHHQPSCLPASNLNKNININKNTKNIAIFLINKNTPTFEVITISHHAFLLAT